MEPTEEAFKRTEKLQEQRNDYHAQISGANPAITIDASTYVFLFLKIAELQLEVEKLNQTIRQIDAVYGDFDIGKTT